MNNNSYRINKQVLLFGLFLGGALLTSLSFHMPLAHADVSLPSWWAGKVCDTNNYPGSYQLSSTSVFYGVLACGPGPNQGGTDHAEQFAGYTFTNYEWECVELSERFMDLVYGVAPYSALGGKDIVPNYSGTTLTKVNNDGTSLPAPGDIFSESGTAQNPYGHTGVITSVNVTNGSGTVSIIEQNSSSTGVNTINVSSNVLQSNVSGWLHGPGLATNPLRIGTVTTTGGYIVKESNLNSSWTTEATASVTQGIQSGTLTGIIESGTFYVKQGDLGNSWTAEWTGATAGALSDASGSNPMRIGILTTSGSFWVREGGLSSGSWVDESDNVVAGYLSGTRVGVLTSSGNLLVKDGSLSSSWTTVAGGVSQAAISGSLIGVIEGGTYYVKQGSLGASWVTEGINIASITMTDAVGSTPLRIGEVTSSGDFWVRESNISTGIWTQVAGGASQGVLSGNLTGVIESGTYYVKQGSLTASWVSESINAASGALWSPN